MFIGRRDSRETLKPRRGPSSLRAGAVTLLKAGSMVSVDHYKQELGAQLELASMRGAMDVLITAGELCRTLSRSSGATDACCQAMQEEIEPGDVVLIERSAGVGMTVRYQLPRTGH